MPLHCVLCLYRTFVNHSLQNRSSVFLIMTLHHSLWLPTTMNSKGFSLGFHRVKMLSVTVTCLTILLCMALISPTSLFVAQAQSQVGGGVFVIAEDAPKEPYTVQGIIQNVTSKGLYLNTGSETILVNAGGRW